MSQLGAALTVALCLPAALLWADDGSTPAVSAPAPDAADGNAAADWNVNSRYTVESVEFTDTDQSDFSRRLREQIQRLTGDKLNMAALKSLAHDIRSELNAHTVSFRVARGSSPDYVRVFFDVDRKHSLDLAIPRFVWDSGQGWTAIGEATLHLGRNAVTVGLLSDGDSLVERFTGYRASFAHRWGSEKPLRLVFAFEDYHEEFGRQTELALSEVPGTPGTYHARRDFAPRLEYTVSRGLTVSAGANFESLQSDLPGAPSTSANSMAVGARWRHENEGAGETRKSTVVSWSLRAATHTLGSDYVYTRNEVTASWTGVWGSQGLEALGDAGMITGAAPLFERFVLGTSTMLRGWNKYDLDPVGGSRLAYGSVTYRYRVLRAFYDVGAIWDPGRPVSPKQSVGAGVARRFAMLGGNELLFALAFPLQQGHLEPVLMAGMNF